VVMPDSLIFEYVMFSIVPVVPEFVLIRHPFWLLEMEESENVMSVTTLLLFPPTEPMLSPWPPEQVIPVTVMLEPEVIATQSSWFLTTVFERMLLEVEEKSKPSELCAAASPPLIEFAASPAELSSVSPLMVNPLPPVMSKQ